MDSPELERLAGNADRIHAVIHGAATMAAKMSLNVKELDAQRRFLYFCFST